MNIYTVIRTSNLTPFLFITVPLDQICTHLASYSMVYGTRFHEDTEAAA
jgi:hypothetical protein